MEYLYNTLQEKEKHFNCENYNRDNHRSVIEVVRIDKGSHYERKVAEPEIIVILKGCISFDNGGMEINTLRGESLLFLSPGTAVSVNVLEPLTVIRFRIDFSNLNCTRLNFTQLAKYKRDIKKAFNVLEVNESLQLFLNPLVFFIDDGMICQKFQKAKVVELLHILAGYYKQVELAGFFYPMLDSNIIFRNTIEKHLPTVHSVEEFCLLTRMSRAGFNDKFRRVYGQAPKTYIKEKRAEMILKELISSEMPLKSLALQYGFKSYEVFSRFCTQMFGNAPSFIRKTAK